MFGAFAHGPSASRIVSSMTLLYTTPLISACTGKMTAEEAADPSEEVVRGIVNMTKLDALMTANRGKPIPLIWDEARKWLHAYGRRFITHLGSSTLEHVFMKDKSWAKVDPGSLHCMDISLSVNLCPCIYIFLIFYFLFLNCNILIKIFSLSFHFSHVYFQIENTLPLNEWVYNHAASIFRGWKYTLHQHFLMHNHRGSNGTPLEVAQKGGEWLWLRNYFITPRFIDVRLKISATEKGIPSTIMPGQSPSKRASLRRHRRGRKSR